MTTATATSAYSAADLQKMAALWVSRSTGNYRAIEWHPTPRKAEIWGGARDCTTPTDVKMALSVVGTQSLGCFHLRGVGQGTDLPLRTACGLFLPKARFASSQCRKMAAFVCDKMTLTASLFNRFISRIVTSITSFADTVCNSNVAADLSRYLCVVSRYGSHCVARIATVLFLITCAYPANTQAFYCIAAHDMQGGVEIDAEPTSMLKSNEMQPMDVQKTWEIRYYANTIGNYHPHPGYESTHEYIIINTTETEGYLYAISYLEFPVGKNHGVYQVRARRVNPDNSINDIEINDIEINDDNTKILFTYFPIYPQEVHAGVVSMFSYNLDTNSINVRASTSIRGRFPEYESIGPTRWLPDEPSETIDDLVVHDHGTSFIDLRFTTKDSSHVLIAVNQSSDFKPEDGYYNDHLGENFRHIENNKPGTLTVSFNNLDPETDYTFHIFPYNLTFDSQSNSVPNYKLGSSTVEQKTKPVNPDLKLNEVVQFGRWDHSIVLTNLSVRAGYTESWTLHGVDGLQWVIETEFTPAADSVERYLRPTGFYRVSSTNALSAPRISAVRLLGDDEIELEVSETESGVSYALEISHTGSPGHGFAGLSAVEAGGESLLLSAPLVGYTGITYRVSSVHDENISASHHAPLAP